MTAVVKRIDGPGLPWSSGAPVPVVMSSEQVTLLAYEAQDGRAQTLEFVGCVSLRFGFPNDETLHGHPLYGAGLQFYEAHVVEDSPWLEELAAIERVHERAPKTPFAGAQHFVLTFHDSTLEAVASAMTARDTYESMEAAARAMASEVTEGL